MRDSIDKDSDLKDTTVRRSTVFPVSRWVSLILLVLFVAFGSNHAGYAQDDNRDEEQFKSDKARLLQMLDSLPASPGLEKVKQAVQASKLYLEMKEATRSVTLADVQINPESRVKIAAVNSRLELPASQALPYLIYVENTAGMKSPLRIQPFDLSTRPVEPAKWCSVTLVENKSSSPLLSGVLDEFKLIELQVDGKGLREVRLVADAGQGTQDLGFRATTDILIDAK